MQLSKKLRNIQKTFVISIIGLVGFSVISLGAVLYATNAIELRHDVSSNKLTNLTTGYTEVQGYIQSHKNAEPHFITIANLVKTDQQKLIARALLFTGVPMLLLSTLLAYLLARKLVKPVEETFADQERFLQDASHEMRNPLAAISAVIQDGRNASSPKEITKTFDILERQTQQLVKLNEDLLRLERSKSRPDRVTQNNLSELLLDVIDSEYAQATKRKITIKAAVTPNVKGFIDDKDWVCITQNLIDNAVKYSKPGGRVNIKLSQTKQYILLTVKDNGIGIPPTEVTQIGKRFYRASNVGRTPGTGLGVAIVSQIISSYKGDIDITSKPNRGTVVVTRFPIK